jgi:hypothetical protein
MQRDIQYDSLETFVDTISQFGVTTVVIGVTDEIRSRHVEGTLYGLGRHRFLEVLAYSDSTLHKCTLHEADPDEVESILREKGFSTSRKDRNIV